MRTGRSGPVPGSGESHEEGKRHLPDRGPDRRGGRAAALWIFLPLLLTAAALEAIAGLRVLSDINLDPLAVAIGGIALGTGLMPLAAPGGVEHRGLIFLRIFGAMALAGLGLVVSGIAGGGYVEIVRAFFVFAVLAPLAPLSLTLASISCRRAYRPGRFLVHLLGWSLAVAIVLAVPFFLLGLASGASPPEAGIVFVFLAAIALAVLLVQLPIFILCFLQPFYRERLRDLLGRPSPPVDMPLSS